MKSLRIITGLMPFTELEAKELKLDRKLSHFGTLVLTQDDLSRSLKRLDEVMTLADKEQIIYCLYNSEVPFRWMQTTRDSMFDEVDPISGQPLGPHMLRDEPFVLATDYHLHTLRPMELTAEVVTPNETRFRGFITGTNVPAYTWAFNRELLGKMMALTLRCKE